MTLGDKQKLFAKKVGQLLTWLHEHGYEVTFGEATRSNEQAIINALGTSGRAQLRMFLRQNPAFFELERAVADNVGSGIKNSLHEQRLAIDLNLFKDGVYLQKNEEYRKAGEYWQSIGGTWGGEFNDGNHFSLAHEGRK